MYQLHNSTTFYVSQTQGHNRHYNGLAPVPDEYGNGPFRSLDHTLKILATVRKTGIKRPLTVAFTEDYTLSAPLVLSSEIREVTFESFGRRKRILGGVRIEGWQRDSFGGVPCFSAKLPPKKDGSAWRFSDLFINGKRAEPTRFPKEGTLRLRSTEQQEKDPTLSSQKLYDTSRWFLVDPEDLKAIPKVEEAQIHYYHYWIDEHSPIESYDPQTGKLVMSYRSRFTAGALYNGSGSSVTYYLTNVPNSFSAPNEWYLDHDKQTVYYIPEDTSLSPESIEALVPTVPFLFQVEGSDVRFRNLELSCTSGEYESRTRVPLASEAGEEGEIVYGSDVQSVCWASGALRFQNAKRCTVSDCYLHGLGIHGIDIGKGCSHITVENNRIEDICAGGIRVFGAEAGEDPSLAVSDCRIRKNHIAFCGRRYAAGCGILVCDASHNEICDNVIHDLEYSGISVGWVWGYGENPSYGNRISGNHIYNIGRGNLSDMGGIYLLGKQHGTVVSENRIHDVACFEYGAWGIYLDEGSSYVTVENNVVYRTGKECFHLHYGSHNTVRNNLFFSGASSCIRISKEELHDELVFEQNVLVSDGAPVYGSVAGLHTINARRNLLWDCSRPDPVICKDRNGKEYHLREWQNALGLDRGSIVGDPLLRDPKAFDFTLAETSPAFSLGFSPIPEKTAKGS